MDIGDVHLDRDLVLARESGGLLYGDIAGRGADLVGLHLGPEAELAVGLAEDTVKVIGPVPVRAEPRSVELVKDLVFAVVRAQAPPDIVKRNRLYGRGRGGIERVGPGAELEDLEGKVVYAESAAGTYADYLHTERQAGTGVGISWPFKFYKRGFGPGLPGKGSLKGPAVDSQAIGLCGALVAVGAAAVTHVHIADIELLGGAIGGKSGEKRHGPQKRNQIFSHNLPYDPANTAKRNNRPAAVNSKF